MKSPPLSPRLAMIADFVRPGRRVADVGTDHAYVAAALAASGKTPFCIACDINSGPLARAEETINIYGLKSKIELRLSDGLSELREGEAEDIVIAGMGGELIARIVLSCAWLKKKNIRLVLQPMTGQDELRKSLCENGFNIIRESVAAEKDKLYLVMSVEYGGSSITPSPFYCIAGLLPKNGDLLSRRYLLWQSLIIKKAADGIKKSKNGGDVSKMESLAALLLEAAN